VDVLRLWVASVDYSGDVRVGDGIIKQIFESYRKLRNTARFMLGNVDDFDAASDSVDYERLPSLDKYMLGKLSSVLKDVDAAYSRYDYSAVVQSLLRFTTADLSNFYLDAAKDRLYISHADDFRRRSAQTVISLVLDGFAVAVAPILPHMAEDIHLNRKGGGGSVFERTWPTPLEGYPPHSEGTWGLIRRVRDDANKALELARGDKVVGASLDAQLVVGVDDGEVKRKLENLLVDETNDVDALKYVLMMSQINLVKESEVKGECGEYMVEKEDGLSGLTVGVKKAAGRRCERCWFYDEETGVGQGAAEDLCPRCNSVCDKIGFVKKPKGAAAEDGVKV
jgi:isoleucyl-tRNA synthetase